MDALSVPVHDRLGRPLRSLRISVTDRCNLRCQYCMPEPDYAWLPRESILDFEEIAVLVDAFRSLGGDRVRIPGGEPLLRRNLPRLIELIAARPAVRDLALTTNGVLLADQASTLRSAGLHRITVSLDTLRRDRFQAIARFDELDAVLAGIDAASRAGFDSLKIDTVVIRGKNDDELPALLQFARGVNAELRFIEYMDVGGANHWSIDAVRPPGPSAPVRRSARSSRASKRSSGPSRCCPAVTRRPRSASAWATAPPSGSLRRRRSRSARRAIAVASRPTAYGSCASTRAVASICASRCAKGRRLRSSCT